MAISFISSTRAPATYPSSTNNTSDCILTKPTGTVEGDVVIVFLESGGGSTFSYPAGWREVSNYQNSSANMTSGVAFKVMTASEASSYTFTDSQSDGTPLCGMLLTYRGVKIDDPINDPVIAHTESNTGTSGTSAVVAPSATTTANSWFLWFRAGKISTTNPSENGFTVSGGTAVLRQATSNRGGSTEYFVAATDSNSVRAAGTHSGATFTRTGSGTFSGSLARTVVLQQADDPTVGSIGATLGGLTFSSGGEVHNDALLDVDLGGISVEAAGEHFPPAVGPLDVDLGGISVAFTATSVGGGFTASLGPVSATFGGAVNPIGAFSGQLAPIEFEFGSETRVFGKNVILVETEKRSFRVTQDELIPIYKAQVGFEPIASPFEITLGRVGMALTAETTSGDIGVNLGAVTANWSGLIFWGDFDGVGLGGISIGLAGGSIGGSLVWELPKIAIATNGNEEFAGGFGLSLAPVTVEFTDSPAGPIGITLGAIDMEISADHLGGDIGMELGPIGVEFDGSVVTEDILKYAEDVGDGSNTTYTVTHSAGTRDVIVSVFDNTTYEEVVPLTTHATTNTVTVEFAAAPATDAYRVVVLYSTV